MTETTATAQSQTPQPRPAAPVARVLAQARFEAGGLLRHGEQLLASLVLPVLALLGMAFAPYPDLSVGRFSGIERIDVVAPGVLALAVMSTAFTGQAILLAFERRWGVLRLLGTTPLGRGGLLAAKALSVLTVIAVQVIVLSCVGMALGWRPDLLGVLPALLFLVMGAGTFAALAACLGGAVRAETTLALANLIWVLLAAGGAVLAPVAAYPGFWGGVVAWLPSAALAEGLREALVHGVFPLLPLLILLGWGLLAGLAARRFLRWSD